MEIVILVIATLGAICWAVTVGQAPGYAVTCTAHQILAVSLCDTETAAIPVPQMRKSRLRVGGGGEGSILPPEFLILYVWGGT